MHIPIMHGGRAGVDERFFLDRYNGSIYNPLLFFRLTSTYVFEVSMYVSLAASVGVVGSQGGGQSLGSGVYRGTSLIRKRPPPQDHHRALGIGLL